MFLPAASDSVRRASPRATAWRAWRGALCAALAAGLLLPVTQARSQAAGGQIHIPGPGEARAAPSGAAPGSNGDAAGAMITIPGPGEARAAQNGRAPEMNAASASGMITIPGPGEARAAQNGRAPELNAASASGTITIPGPGEARAAQTSGNAQAGAALARAMAAPAASRVMPVVVASAPRAVAARPALPVAAEPPMLPAVGARSALPVAAKPPMPPAAGARLALPVAAQPPMPPAAGARLALPVAAQPSASAALGSAASANAASANAASVNAASANAALVNAASANAAPSGPQDGDSIRRAAFAFLQQQTAGLPGKIGITVAPAFPRGLAACTTLVPFMPPGARLWGRTTVGVRCAGERPWTLYLQARISLDATYYLAARQIEPGEMLSAADLVGRDGDLANLPQAIITDPSQAVGAVALTRIGLGMPLRQDLLRSATSVTIGQTVRVVALGLGFSISAEGSVMNNAAPGQQVRVKMAGGQIVSGIVKDGSTVEIQM